MEKLGTVVNIEHHTIQSLHWKAPNAGARGRAIGIEREVTGNRSPSLNCSCRSTQDESQGQGELRKHAELDSKGGTGTTRFGRNECM